MDRSHESCDELYVAWLTELLEKGSTVPSVTDPLSKASNFGASDRPYLELLGSVRRLNDPRKCVMKSALPVLNLPYCFGHLAWFLMGRDDVDTLAYYRKSAREFSDDGTTLCGSFGRRLFGDLGETDQISALIDRARADPASRRLFAPVITANDTLNPTREFPCAASIQLFVRDGVLHLMSSMRAQQCLTILPYDLFVFAVLQQCIAKELGVPIGQYIHIAGTVHIYQNELEIASRIISERESETLTFTFPEIPSGPFDSLRIKLDHIERSFRMAGIERSRPALEAQLAETPDEEFFKLASACYAFQACKEIGIDDPIWRSLDVGEDWESLIEKA